jgi:hypothetical protein
MICDVSKAAQAHVESSICCLSHQRIPPSTPDVSNMPAQLEQPHTGYSQHRVLWKVLLQPTITGEDQLHDVVCDQWHVGDNCRKIAKAKDLHCLLLCP